MSFTASGGELELLNPAAFKASIDDFDLGGLTNDTIVTNWLFKSAVINGTTSATITLNKGASNATLNLVGDFAGGTFSHTASGGYTTIGFS